MTPAVVCRRSSARNVTWKTLLSNCLLDGEACDILAETMFMHILRMKRSLYCALNVMIAFLYMTDACAIEALGLLPDRGTAHLSFYLDNDLFAGTDENYTNGIRIAWISGSRDPKQFGMAQRGLRKLKVDHRAQRDRRSVLVQRRQ